MAPLTRQSPGHAVVKYFIEIVVPPTNSPPLDDHRLWCLSIGAYYLYSQQNLYI